MINANVAGSLLVTNAVMERTLLRGTPRGRASWKLLGTVDGRFPCPVSHCARTYGSKVSHDAGFPHQRMHPSFSHCMGVNRPPQHPTTETHPNVLRDQHLAYRCRLHGLPGVKLTSYPGYPWLPISCYPWLSLGIPGCLSLAIPGYPWLSRAIPGLLSPAFSAPLQPVP